MVKNEKLDALCSRLAEAQPNWDAIIKKYKSHPKCGQDKVRTLSDYGKYFSEIHLDLSLRELAKDQSLSLLVGIDPVQHLGYKLSDSRFGNLIVSKGGESVIEFDSFALVDNKPVIFELKLGGWTRDRNGIAGYLKKQFYEKRKLLATIIAADSIGSVFIVPKNIYDSHPGESFARPGSTWSKFLEQNGKIIPFYTTADQFRGDVAFVVEKNSFELKPG